MTRRGAPDRRCRTSTGRRTSRRSCRRRRRPRGRHRPPAGLSEGRRCADDGDAVETWKEYLTFGLISAYADDLPAAFVDAQFDFNGKVHRRPPGTSAALEARRGGDRGSARRAGRQAVHRALLQARREGAHGRAHPEPPRGVQGRDRRARVDVARDEGAGAGQARQVHA